MDQSKTDNSGGMRKTQEWLGHQAPAGTPGPSPWPEAQALTHALQVAMACRRWSCDWEAVPGPSRRSPVP